MSQPPISILILDDEWGVRTIFTAVLERAGYAVFTASDALEAAALLEAQQFNLALIDLKLPGPSGLDLLQRLRDWQTSCATVLISANPTREDILEALRAGVDDFLIKPISNEHLRRAVGEALLKHQIRRLPASPEMVVGALRIDTSRRTVYWHDQALTLTSTEYCLLRTLAQHAGRIVPASALIRHCRGYSINEEEARQLIKPHIANLRHKLEQGSRFRRVLLNHRGLGFILSAEESAEATPIHAEPADWV
jgi:DNA-binding response OmpR family regulator